MLLLDITVNSSGKSLEAELVVGLDCCDWLKVTITPDLQERHKLTLLSAVASDSYI